MSNEARIHEEKMVGVGACGFSVLLECRGAIGGSPLQGGWGVTFFGTQLLISQSTIGPSDATGARLTTAQGSIWLLDARGRLIIEFREHRSKERPKTATRV